MPARIATLENLPVRLFRKMKHLPWILRWLLAALLRVWRLSLRVKVIDPRGERTGEPEEPRIYAIWHNRLLLIPVLVPRRRRRQVAFLASRSRDGGYIADLLQSFGMPAVRGSSSKGGAAALRQLANMLAEGFCVSATPDGPRGPRYEVQDGILWLAAQSGYAIVPVAINSPHHKELRGWDRTQLPRPFSTIELETGDPIYIEGPLDAENLEIERARVRAAMLAICRYDHPA